MSSCGCGGQGHLLGALPDLQAALNGLPGGARPHEDLRRGVCLVPSRCDLRRWPGDLLRVQLWCVN